MCAVWWESSLCAQWVAKDPSFLHADREDWSSWVDAQARQQSTLIEPRHDKTNKMAVRPTKTQISLIWVFAGRTLVLLVLSCRGSYLPETRRLGDKAATGHEAIVLDLTDKDPTFTTIRKQGQLSTWMQTQQEKGMKLETLDNLSHVYKMNRNLPVKMLKCTNLNKIWHK